MAILTTVPTSGKGKVNDVLGMVAVDSTHFYYTNANYDGSTVIWFKVAKGNAVPVPVPLPPAPPPPSPPPPPRIPAISVVTNYLSKEDRSRCKVTWTTYNATSLSLNGAPVALKSTSAGILFSTRQPSETIILTFIATGPGGAKEVSSRIRLYKSK